MKHSISKILCTFATISALCISPLHAQEKSPDLFPKSELKHLLKASLVFGACWGIKKLYNQYTLERDIIHAAQHNILPLNREMMDAVAGDNAFKILPDGSLSHNNKSAYVCTRDHYAFDQPGHNRSPYPTTFEGRNALVLCLPRPESSDPDVIQAANKVNLHLVLAQLKHKKDISHQCLQLSKISLKGLMVLNKIFVTTLGYSAIKNCVHYGAAHMKDLVFNTKTVPHAVPLKVGICWMLSLIAGKGRSVVDENIYDGVEDALIRKKYSAWYEIEKNVYANNVTSADLGYFYGYLDCPQRKLLVWDSHRLVKGKEQSRSNRLVQCLDHIQGYPDTIPSALHGVILDYVGIETAREVGV